MDPFLKKMLEDCNIGALEVLRDISEDLMQLDDSFEVVCAGVHKNFVLWFIEKYPETLKPELIKKCGTFEIFKILMNKYQKVLNDELLIEGFKMACSNGDIETLDLIFKDNTSIQDKLDACFNNKPEPDQIPTHPFTLSTIAGHVQVNNYLIKHFSFIDNHIYEIPDFLQFVQASANGHSEMIEWIGKNYFLVVNQGNWRKDCFIAACTNSQFTAADKLVEIFGIKSIYSTCYTHCMEFALRNNIRRILYYLTEKFSSCENFSDTTKNITSYCKQEENFPTYNEIITLDCKQ